jgi:hypothetical protein
VHAFVRVVVPVCVFLCCVSVLNVSAGEK